MNPKDCKYFDKCSCNVCPLDPDRKEKSISPLDKVRYCLLEKKLGRKLSVEFDGEFFRTSKIS